MKILIPLIRTNEDNKVSFAEVTNAYLSDRIDVISINDFDEETKLKELAKEISGSDSPHYQVVIEPRFGNVKEITDYDVGFMSLVPLGILLAIEKLINYRFFKEYYDTLIVVGNVEKGSLVAVNDIEDIYDAANNYAEEHSNEKVHLIYVASDDINNTTSPMNQRMLMRLEPGLPYTKALEELFSAVGDEELFFENWIEKAGLPYGRNKLDAKDIKYRESSYRFTYKKGDNIYEKRLVGVRKINSAGLPYAYSGPVEDPVFQEFYYNDSDKPDIPDIIVLYKTKSGKIKYRKEVKKETDKLCIVTFHNCLEAGPFFFNSDFMEYKPETIANIGSLPDACEGKEWRVEHNQCGFMTKKLARISKNEIYGMEYTYDDDDTGNIRKEYFLGQDGKRIVVKGIAGYEMQYDSNNNMIERKMIHAPGAVHDNSCWSRAELKYDLRNRQKSCTVYNEQGTSCTVKTSWRKFPHTVKTDDGHTVLKREYDWLGYCTSVKSIENARYTEVRRVFNEGTLPIEISYLDDNQELVLGEDGIAFVKTKYDSDRNRTEETYFGIYGQLTEDGRGIAKITQSYEYHGSGAYRYIKLYGLSEVDNFKESITLIGVTDALFYPNPIEVPSKATAIKTYLQSLNT